MVKKAAKKAVIFIIWIAVWQIAYLCVGQDILIPSPLAVAQRLWFLLGEISYWKSIIASMARILAGYIAGLLAGCVLALFSTWSSFLNDFLRPLLSIIRATPVASFIILVFFWLSKDAVPIFTTFLMVLGLVWANVMEGIGAVRKDLLEMATVFRFSKAAKFRNVYIPSVQPFFTAAAVTSLGFAWKAGIAAEVICHPAFSIGNKLYNAKVYLEIPDLFAWTATIILFSVLLEKIIVRLLPSPAEHTRK